MHMKVCRTLRLVMLTDRATSLLMTLSVIHSSHSFEVRVSRYIEITQPFQGYGRDQMIIYEGN